MHNPGRKYPGPPLTSRRPQRPRASRERQIGAATTKHGRCSNIDRAHDTEPVA